jgi:magnesium transporter
MTEVLHGLGAAERERVAVLRAQQRFFWLDVSLHETTRDELVDALAIPAHAVRVLTGFGDARASRTFHADGESLVFALRCYAESETVGDEAGYRLRPVEVKILVTGDYLLTLHEERVSLPAVLDPDLPEGRSQGYMVYSVLDAILASTFDALEEVELRLDALASGSTDGGGGRVSRTTLREAAARLSSMRRWMTAEQAVFERLSVEIGTLRGFDASGQPDFERLDDQVDRLLASIDAAANGMGMLLDLQLNERAYVVSVVATIFVPLTFITGFFGMNFGWMIDRLDTAAAFWVVGILVPITTTALAWRLLMRRFFSGDVG